MARGVLRTNTGALCVMPGGELAAGLSGAAQQQRGSCNSATACESTAALRRLAAPSTVQPTAQERPPAPRRPAGPLAAATRCAQDLDLRLRACAAWPLHRLRRRHGCWPEQAQSFGPKLHEQPATATLIIASWCSIPSGHGGRWQASCGRGRRGPGCPVGRYVHDVPAAAE